MVFTMDPSFETLYSLPCHATPRRSRSPRFLATVKELVHRPSNRSLKMQRPNSSHRKNASKDSPRPRSCESSVRQALWKRRGQTPGMDDYLTLAQLENVWHTQDYYVGCVSAPQKITQYTFQEAVEAPLVAKHGTGARAHSSPRSAPDLKSHSPTPDHHIHTTVIDGATHPALRPVPYLTEEKSPAMVQQSIPLNRFAISVPDTNWTYGRGQA